MAANPLPAIYQFSTAAISIFLRCPSVTPSFGYAVLRLRRPSVTVTPNAILHVEPIENYSVWCWNVLFDEEKAVRRATNSRSGAEFAASDVRHVLTAIEYSIVQALVDVVKRDETPLFAMHAALLCKENFGLIVVGPRESGKSTLSCAL